MCPDLLLVHMNPRETWRVGLSPACLPGRCPLSCSLYLVTWVSWDKFWLAAGKSGSQLITGSVPIESHWNHKGLFWTGSASVTLAFISMLLLLCMCTKLLQSCLTFCNPMDHSPLGSSVYGISQARILEWAAISFSRASSRHRIELRPLMFPALPGRFFATKCTPNDLSQEDNLSLPTYRRLEGNETYTSPYLRLAVRGDICKT